MPILKASKEETHEILVLVAKASKGTMVMSFWQKPIMGATLNQTCKGAMIASLWKESAEKL